MNHTSTEVDAALFLTMECHLRHDPRRPDTDGTCHDGVCISIAGLVSITKLTFLDFLPVFFAALAAIGIAFLQQPLLASVMVLVIPTGLYLIVKQVSSYLFGHHQGQHSLWMPANRERHGSVRGGQECLHIG